MMKYKIIITLHLISFATSAQDCTPELLAKRPGTWKAGLKGSIVNVTPKDLAKERAVLAEIQKMISSKYNPAGCQILTSTVFGKSTNAAANWMADPYYLSLYVLRYLCDPNSADKSKSYIDISTPTTVNIAVNQISSLSILYAGNLPEDDFRGYLKLTKKPVKKDGYYYMGEEIMGDPSNKIKEYRWIITYNDTLPFSFVNRREYLLIQKKRLEKDMQDSPGDKKWLTQYMNAIDDYLKKSSDELDQPAICMWNEEQRFEKFVPESTRGSFIAVKPNLNYYHKNLPASSPQFFTVVYKIAHGDPVFEENIANIQKAVDFGALRNMLGR